MNVSFKASFARDLQKIANANILKRIQTAIEQVEQTQDLRSVDNLNNNWGQSKINNLGLVQSK